MLNGKVALVTGGATGIGLEIARVFSENGAYVYIADMNYEEAEQAASLINDSGQEVTKPVLLDVCDESCIKSVVAQIAEEKGKLDILVNNAGIHKAHKIVDYPLSDWEQVFKVNMTGTFICSREAAKIMIQRKSGVILTVSACSAKKADNMHAAYSSSKAAQIEFNRILALELGPYGIRCNCILPGATETVMLKKVFENVPGLRESIVEKTILGKLGAPRDQANAALFLASDLASHITGEYLVVSGGEFLNP